MMKISTAIAASLFSVVFIFLINTYGGRVEGWVAPVATADSIKFQIVDHDETVLNGTMVKVRACEFIGLQAFLTNPLGDRILAPMRVGESLKLRPQGDHSWGPWVVDLPIWKAEHRMEIMVYHKCNNFYVTETVFWHSDLANPISQGDKL